MKNLLKTTLVLILILLFSNCSNKDAEPGPVGSKGDTGQSGPSAKSYLFNGSFSASVTGLNYTGLVGKVGEDDAVLVYVYTGQTSGVDYYAQLTATFPNSTNPFIMYSDLGDNGSVIVRFARIDNSGVSPFSSSTPFVFKGLTL